MKKKITPLLLWIMGSLALMAIGYFVLLEIHPKNAKRVPIYLFLFYLDLFLWMSIWYYVKHRNKIIKIVASFLYWLPMACAIVMALVAIDFPTYRWNDFWRIYPGGIIFSVYMAKIIPVAFIILTKIITFSRDIFLRFTKKESNEIKYNSYQLSHRIIQFGWVTGIVFFVFLLLGIFVFSSHFEVNKQQIFIKNLPEEFDGYRIVQISDLHLGSWHSENDLKKAVKIINDLNPDLFVFTGDLVNYLSFEADRFTETLSGIKSKSGNFAILGNHDYGDYVKWRYAQNKRINMDKLNEYYNKIGWRLLKNKSKIIRSEHDSILIIGVENWGRMRRFPKKADLDSAIAGNRNIEVKIQLSHDPTYWEDIVSKKYKDIQLTLSGHIHGFQIGLKIGQWKWSPAIYSYKYWDGFYEMNHPDGTKQYLYVNRGLGSLLYPGRLGMNPEITLIELKKE